MANIQTYPLRKVQIVDAATAAALTTAINSATKAIAANIIGITDVTGAPSGTQTVYPNTIDIQYGGTFINKATNDLYSAMIIYVEQTQL
jgi:hypothetical protein